MKSNSIVVEIARLRTLPVAQLRVKYAEVFGEEARSNNKDYLWKRIAFRIQERAEGGLSERARRRAEELADEADLRIIPSRAAAAAFAAPLSPRRRDPRLPPPGTVLRRTWAGREHVVLALEEGFELDGRRFRSLSAVARAITGTRWNGHVFFGTATSSAGEAR
jgi:hypothetical protein